VEHSGHLHWKKIPSHTYILREEKNTVGFKTATDYLTFLFGGNTEDVKFKPLLVYLSENSVALKGYANIHLPMV
jgi:hypothetical protein